MPRGWRTGIRHAFTIKPASLSIPAGAVVIAVRCDEHGLGHPVLIEAFEGDKAGFASFPRLALMLGATELHIGLTDGTMLDRISTMRDLTDRSEDVCDGQRVAGSARDEAHPDGPVCLDILVDGAVVGLALAQDYRADLAAAGLGDGRHGFDIALDEPLARGVAHTVEVRRSADGLRVYAMAVDAAGTWTALLAA